MRRLKSLLSSSTSLRISSGEGGHVWAGTWAGLKNCSRRFSRTSARKSLGLCREPSVPSCSENEQSVGACWLRPSWWKQHSGTYTPNLYGTKCRTFFIISVMFTNTQDWLIITESRHILCEPNKHLKSQESKIHFLYHTKLYWCIKYPANFLFITNQIENVFLWPNTVIISESSVYKHWGKLFLNMSPLSYFLFISEHISA